MVAGESRRPRGMPSVEGGASPAGHPSVAEAAVATARGTGGAGRLGYARIADQRPLGHGAEGGGGSGGARIVLLQRASWLLLPCGVLGTAVTLLSRSPAGTRARLGGGEVVLQETPREEAIGCGRRGCGSYSPTEPCQCNPDCGQHGNCCADYSSVCAPPPRELNEEVHGAGSCDAYGCVEYSHTLACQCNAGCLEHRDCCDDFASTCGGVQPERSAGDWPADGVAPGQGQQPDVEWSSNDRDAEASEVPSVLGGSGAADDLGPAAAEPIAAPTATPTPKPEPPVDQEAHWCDEAPEVGDLWSPNGGEPPTMHLKVLLYNVHWELAFTQGNGDGKPVKELIAASMIHRPFDLMALQSCEDAMSVLEEVRPGQYIAFQSGGELCTAVRMSQFALISQGEASVAEDGPSDFQVGNRTAAWVRLNHTATGRIVFFMNYHGPTPYNTGGLCGHSATASRLLGLVASNGEPGDTVVLAGDFSASEDSGTVGGLKAHFAIANQGIVAGGTDFVLTNLEGVVVANATNLGNGGSDHDALSTMLRVGPGTTTSTTTTRTSTSTRTATTTTTSKTSTTTTTDERGQVALHVVPQTSHDGDGEFVDGSVKEALEKIAAQDTGDIAELDDSQLDDLFDIDTADVSPGPAGGDAEEGELVANEEGAVR